MIKHLTLTLTAIGLATTPVVAEAQTREERKAAAEERKRLGSLYLRCDGEPNNMTGGESFARLLGAVTLLGLFAPQPETPDPSKRLFAEEGVDACNQLIEGPKAEGNAIRRLPLILARALHQIEAKNYEAALQDVALARQEATAANLAGNPYFDRSMGLSFSKIEGEAKLRMGDAAGAQAASLSPVAEMKYSFMPNLLARDYNEHLPELTQVSEARLKTNGKILPVFLIDYADELDEVGRFEESAKQREAYITFTEGMNPENSRSIIYARTALAHALAGSWPIAIERAEFARSNLAQRKVDGKPEKNASEVVEVLDLYEIVKLAFDGDVKGARRNFAARSQWVEPSFGAVMEVNRRLREGAEEEEIFGSLKPTAEEMWQKRSDELMAAKLQKDTDNKTLFRLIQPYAKVNEYEDRSKRTWRIAKSKMMSKEPDEDGMFVITSPGSLTVAADSIMLHAALQAKDRGKEGFTMFLLPLGFRSIGLTRFVDRAEGGDELFIPAEEVITELSELIPSPDELKRRKKARK
jgi:hypothetical protein